MNVVAIAKTQGGSSLQWWTDRNSVALVKRTAAKDCNADEFDQFVSVCRELGLSPLRKQIYAFVFSKDDAAKRQMALVVGIDGGRSIAARSGNYRPDNLPPQWVFDETAKNALTNPHGIVSCTVGVFHRPTKNDDFARITATVFWDEFAPLVKAGDDADYEWIDTGETWSDSGKPKKKKQLRRNASAVLRLDPKKEQWTRAGRHKIALCAEMQALRRGWPEDMSRLYVEEETDRAAAVIEADYVDLTPSEMVARADVDARVEKLGGPALFAALGDDGALIRVPRGQFADRMLEATASLPPEQVTIIVGRNKEALNEFWAHNKTDALELKKELERRSGVAAAANKHVGDDPAKAAAPQPREAAGAAAKPGPGALSGQEAQKLASSLINQLQQMSTANDLLGWSNGAKVHLDRLPADLRREVETEFQRHQETVLGAK